LCFKNEFHLSRMAVRKSALVRVLGQHMAALDVDGLANPVWHFGQQIDLSSRGKGNFNFPICHGS